MNTTLQLHSSSVREWLEKQANTQSYRSPSSSMITSLKSLWAFVVRKAFRFALKTKVLAYFSIHVPLFNNFPWTASNKQHAPSNKRMSQSPRTVTSFCDMLPMVKSRSSGQFSSLSKFVLDVIVSIGIKGWALWFAKMMTSPKHIFMKVLSGQYMKGLVLVFWVKQPHLTVWSLCITLECVFSISVMFSHCVL